MDISDKQLAERIRNLVADWNATHGYRERAGIRVELSELMVACATRIANALDKSEV